MLSKVYSCCFLGLEGYSVEVETFISSGLPTFSIVGLPDASVTESKERVRSAIKNSGMDFPMNRITINMAPADIKKEGSYYDLPIALGVLISSGQLSPQLSLEDAVFIGELSLSGEVKRVNGVLTMAIALKEMGFKRLVVPEENMREAAMVEGIGVFGVRSLAHAASMLCDPDQYAPHKNDCPPEGDEIQAMDFIDVKGQENAKRALEIAAAGMHNIILIGPPGSGKTMLARRLPSILPDLTHRQALEVTKIYSIAGKLQGKSVVYRPPFRSPHHTVSAASLVGGGKIPKPGEISLAHHGVLFLDEMPEFPRRALEALRQPMESDVVTVSRVNATLSYPAKFLLAASANPCPCGYYGDNSRECRCSPNDIQRYFGRISGPLMDRIDLQVEVGRVEMEDLSGRVGGTSSQAMRERVLRAREFQYARFAEKDISYNSQLTARELEEYGCITGDAREFINNAYRMIAISARGYVKVLKVARTIADIEQRERVEVADVAEALQYRISCTKDGM